MPAGIFLSYRRDDSAGFAGRLYDRLASRYGADRLFMDVDTIRPGHDFAEDIVSCALQVRCVRRIDRPTLGIDHASRWAAEAGRSDRLRPTRGRGGDTSWSHRDPRPRRGCADAVAGVVARRAPGAVEATGDRSEQRAVELRRRPARRWRWTRSSVSRSMLRAKETPRKSEPRRRIATMPVLIVAAAVVLSLIGVVGWLATRGQDPTVATGPTGGSSSSPSSDSGNPTGEQVHVGASLVAAFFRGSPIRVV